MNRSFGLLGEEGEHDVHGVREMQRVVKERSGSCEAGEELFGAGHRMRWGVEKERCQV